jgi:Flp pilus assembly pilin Flp
MTAIWTDIEGLLRSERGATMVEYSLVVVLIGVVSLLVVGALGTDVFGQFDGAQSAYPGAVPGGPTP